MLNGFIIAMSFHILVLGLGIITTSIDNTVMLYRDISQMVRVPVSLYQEPLRSLLTFVVPVGIMVSFPAESLVGLLSAQAVILAFCISAGFLLMSLWFWNFSLKRYASASS